MPVYSMRCPACKATFDVRAKAGETTCLCIKCKAAIAHSVICAPTLAASRKTEARGRN